jgi:hypothetical protein
MRQRFIASTPVRTLPFRRLSLLAVSLIALGVAMSGCAFLSNSVKKSNDVGLATPAPAFTSHGPLAGIVDPAIWGAGVRSVDTTFDAAQAKASVTITLGGTVPNTDAKVSAAQELAKGFCFMAEQALWANASSYSEVTVIVQGPTQDEYANIVTGAYAVAVVESRGGRSIPWATTTSDSAWQTYDTVFLTESFVLVD